MALDKDKYKYLIETLATAAHNFDFYEQLTSAMSGEDEEIKFLVAMEIKRLAQPCITSIDLRALVEEECEVFLYEGVKHYLSAPAIERFNQLLEQYGTFTVGVKEDLLTFYENKRDESLGITNTSNSSADPRTFISYYESFLNYPVRKGERLLVDIEIRLFLSSTLVLEGIAVDISKSGLRVHLLNESEISFIKGYKPIQIVFVGLGEESKISSTPIAYRIMGISNAAEKSNIHLVRDWEQGPKTFNKFIDELFNNNKKNALVETTNTQLAIESKVYEQAFALNCQGLSLFVNTQKISEPFVEFACANDYNLSILDYWKDESQNQVLGYIFSKDRLTRLLIDCDSGRDMIIYCFNHLNNGKLYFYSASELELDKNPELKDVFLSYSSRKASWKVLKLECHQIEPSRAHLPSSLPNGINSAINDLNRGLAPKIVAKLEHLHHMITLTDITHEQSHTGYHDRDLNKEKIKLLSVFGHAKNRLPKAIEVLKFAWLDKRREKRYKLRTEVEIFSGPKKCTGATEDISTRGLKLELDTNIKTKQNATVYVSFPSLQEITQQYKLVELPYRVMHVSEDGYILHLQAHESDEDQVAKAFFAMLIENNREKLPAITNNLETADLRNALRTLQARYTPQLCVLLHQQKDTQYPVKTVLNPSKSYAFKYLKHNMPANYFDLSCIFVPKSDTGQFVSNCLNTARKSNTPISKEVYIMYDVGAPNADSAVKPLWEGELPSHIDKYQFIREAVSKYQFYACRVTCTGKSTPITVLYDVELNYLRKTQPQQAKNLESLAWNFSGHLFLTDITSEVLLRYRLVQG